MQRNSRGQAGQPLTHPCHPVTAIRAALSTAEFDTLSPGSDFRTPTATNPPSGAGRQAGLLARRAENRTGMYSRT
jgi:hypothetical protein